MLLSGNSLPVFGGQIDSNITLNYEGGTTRTVALTSNMLINPLSYQGIVEVNDTNTEPTLQGAPLIIATFYLDLDNSKKGKILSAKLNMFGNPDPENLAISLVPLISYTRETEVIDFDSVSAANREIDLGN